MDSSFSVNLDDYFFEEPDGVENPTLIDIRNINKPTRFWFDPITYSTRNIRNVLFEHESKDVFRERLRRVFRAVSENANINEVEITGSHFNFPGALIAEWLEWNKFVKQINFYFGETQSDMPLLCDALQRDTTIETIKVFTRKLQNPDIILFGNALRGNRGIVHMECSGDNNSLLLLQQALGPGSNIKTIDYDCFLSSGIAIDCVNSVKNILSVNSSLTSLKIRSNIDENCSMIPILRGVMKSTVSSFHFSFNGRRYKREREIALYQNELMKIFSDMPKVQFFSFRLQNFSGKSAEFISFSLKGMKSLESLEIDASDCKNDQLKEIIQCLSTWESKCKLKLTRCCCPNLELITLLKLVKLETFECTHNPCSKLDKIIAEIPSWNFLKKLRVHMDTESSELDWENCLEPLEKQIIAVLRGNSSLHQISIQNWNTRGYFLSYATRDTVNKILARNQRLAECNDNPESVPISQWPELFAMAEPTGLNFSYECIRKNPSIFLDLFCSHIQQEGNSMTENVRILHMKREASLTTQNETAKRARQIQAI